MPGRSSSNSTGSHRGSGDGQDLPRGSGDSTGSDPPALRPSTDSDSGGRTDGTAHYSNKVDVYSFGVLLWSMWSGQRPFGHMRGNQIQFMRQICRGARPPMGASLFPKPLQELLTLAWHPDSTRRPTMADMAAKLGAPEFRAGLAAGLQALSPTLQDAGPRAPGQALL